MSDYFIFCKDINFVLKNQENLLKFIFKNSDLPCIPKILYNLRSLIQKSYKKFGKLYC